VGDGLPEECLGIRHLAHILGGGQRRVNKGIFLKGSTDGAFFEGSPSPDDFYRTLQTTDSMTQCHTGDKRADTRLLPGEIAFRKVVRKPLQVTYLMQYVWCPSSALRYI
jgi:hypothetical protein